jgi:ATP-dependent DNA helicase RecG
MTNAELLEIINLGETSNIEFKETIHSPDQLSSEMVAFANSIGGKIFIGINDDGEITGLEGKELKKLQDLVMNVATNNCNPPLGSIWTEVARLQNKSILIVHIEKGITLHRDNTHSVWVRVGPNKRKVFDNAELSRLMQEKRLIYAEQQIIENTAVDDLNLLLFKDFYKNRFEQEVLDDKSEIFRTLNNLRLLKGDKLTLASLLLFGKNNEYILPQFCIKAIWFQTNEFITDKYRSSVNIYGSLTEQYNKAKDFVISKLNYVQKDKDFNSIGDLEIPELVIKELLINALFHRDYFIEDSIKLFVFPNRIEIKNPGKLPNNLTVEDIKQGIQRRDRNILLTSYAIDLLPYRGIGSGVLRSIKAYPDIDVENNSEGNFFKVTIKRPEQ